MLGLLLSALMVFYYFEHKRVVRIRKDIHSVISVTGSRGKSTTVKFLCALFQKAGFRVLGKVTGTQPLLIYPDGSCRRINRRGSASILEQKSVLLKKASIVKPEILISEIMSITPEYQKIECRNIINPDYYIITDVKDDHLGITGDNKKEIAEVFLSSAPENSKVFVLENEKGSFEPSQKRFKDIVFLQEDLKIRDRLTDSVQPGFYQTLLFAKAMCEEFDIGIDLLEKTVEEYEFDDKVFFKREIGRGLIAINAFSANDVESTRYIYESFKADFEHYRKIGIFCTRGDKPDRTKQWIKSLQDDRWDFDELWVFGPNYSSIRRKKYDFSVIEINEKDFERIFSPEAETFFFGFGNFVGSGEKIVERWKGLGEGS